VIFVPAILAIAKAAPAVARLVSDLTDAWAAYQTENNAKDENAKNDRNSAAIAAAARPGVSNVCASCPFARKGGGQYGEANATPAISGGRPSGTGISQ
jgi:hypothetical protein